MRIKENLFKGLLRSRFQLKTSKTHKKMLLLENHSKKENTEMSFNNNTVIPLGG